MYLQDQLMFISSEEPQEEEVGISQASPVTEEVVSKEEVDLDMDNLKEEDLDMEEVEVEEAVEADVVAVAVMV